MWFEKPEKTGKPGKVMESENWSKSHGES
jgi:hypothetical protein